jgi:hypothetical protein
LEDSLADRRDCFPEEAVEQGLRVSSEGAAGNGVFEVTG